MGYKDIPLLVYALGVHKNGSCGPSAVWVSSGRNLFAYKLNLPSLPPLPYLVLRRHTQSHTGSLSLRLPPLVARVSSSSLCAQQAGGGLVEEKQGLPHAGIEVKTDSAHIELTT